jgi:hypothetical protein
MKIDPRNPKTAPGEAKAGKAADGGGRTEALPVRHSRTIDPYQGGNGIIVSRQGATLVLATNSVMAEQKPITCTGEFIKQSPTEAPSLVVAVLIVCVRSRLIVTILMVVMVTYWNTVTTSAWGIQNDGIHLALCLA